MQIFTFAIMLPILYTLTIYTTLFRPLMHIIGKLETYMVC